ncbi:MAG: hypothetical protein KKI02_05635, partial [Planctomycetes bacterium]|nr:hypothetical protein [Planctomycetota bacterium]
RTSHFESSQMPSDLVIARNVRVYYNLIGKFWMHPCEFDSDRGVTDDPLYKTLPRQPSDSHTLLLSYSGSGYGL